MLQSTPHLKNSQVQMAVRRSPQGLSPKAGAASPQARASAYSDRLSQLEKDMAEVRDGTIKEVLEKLRLLSYEIEEINRRFDTVDRTGDTLDDFRVRVNCYENEISDLRRQVERGSAPLPSQNQQAGTDRFPIPMFSGAFLHMGFILPVGRRAEPQLSCYHDWGQIA